MLNVKKILLGVACVVVITSIIVGGKYLISVRNYQKTIKELTINNVDLSKIPDGKYIGSYDVNLISAKFQLQLKTTRLKI